MPVPKDTPVGGDVINKNYMELNSNDLYIPPINA